MSCWVVPTVAAEFWGVPLQQVLDGMASGEITSKIDSGFTFVDVAPDSPIFEAPKPPTCMVVSNEELAALNDEPVNLAEVQKVREDTTKLRVPPLAA
jgi:hypothetical protein